MVVSLFKTKLLLLKWIYVIKSRKRQAQRLIFIVHHRPENNGAKGKKLIILASPADGLWKKDRKLRPVKDATGGSIGHAIQA